MSHDVTVGVAVLIYIVIYIMYTCKIYLYYPCQDNEQVVYRAWRGFGLGIAPGFGLTIRLTDLLWANEQLEHEKY